MIKYRSRYTGCTQLVKIYSNSIYSRVILSVFLAHSPDPLGFRARHSWWPWNWALRPFVFNVSTVDDASQLMVLGSSVYSVRQQLTFISSDDFAHCCIVTLRCVQRLYKRATNKLASYNWFPQLWGSSGQSVDNERKHFCELPSHIFRLTEPSLVLNWSAESKAPKKFNAKMNDG